MKKTRLFKLSSVLAKVGFSCAVAALLGGGGSTARADYVGAVTNLGPVGYYRLNDTTSPATDFSTNLGSLGAAANAYYNGLFGTDYTHPVAGALAGSNDTAAQTLTGKGCIVVPYNPILNGDTFTYECWFNPTGSGAAVMSDVDFLNDGRHGFIFYYGVNATWDIRIYTGSGTAFAANIEDNTVVTPVNGWYHFVVTCDGSTVVLYVNGAPITNSPFVNYGPAPAAPFIIGSRSDGSYTLDGSYDEAAIYTNALSAARVLAHFQNGTNAALAPGYKSVVLADTPVGYWRLDEPTFTATAPVAVNSGTLGTSVNGTYDPGVIADVAGPPYAGMTGGAAAWFNGVVGDVNISGISSAGIYSAQTVMLWFQRDAWANQWQSLIGQDDNAFRLGRYALTSQIEYGLFTPSSAYFGNESATQINDTSWHHITAEFNGTNAYIYLDGVLDTNWSAPGDVIDNSGNPVLIGNNSGWNVGRTWAGSISEVAIFDRGLTDAEIQQVYNAAQAPPIIYTQPTVTPPVYEGETVTMTPGVSGALPLFYVWTQNGGSIGQTNKILTLTCIFHRSL